MSRKEHWEQVYRDKSPLEVSWHQSEPKFSLELIAHTALPSSAAIIDVGGGASTLIDHLLLRGYKDLTVLDISANALTHAQNRLGAKANQVQWIEADVTGFAPPQAFNLWHDRAVFHFLTDAADRRNYVQRLRHALKPGGHLIIAAFAIDGPTKCSGLDIVQYDATKLMKELGEGFDLMEEQTEAHITPTGMEQQFAYFRLIYTGQS